MNNRLLALLVVLIPRLLYAQSDKHTIWLDKFDHKTKVNLVNTTWFSFTDKVNQGGSEIVWDYVYDKERKDQVLKFSYTLQKAQWQWEPYVALTFPLTSVQVDLSDVKAIAYEFKGAKHIFQYKTSSVKDYAYYQKTIESSKEWTTTTIPFSELYQPSWGQKKVFLKEDVNSLLWQVVGNSNDTGSVYIDNIRLVKSNYNPAEKFTAQEVKEDLLQLKNAFAEVHPSLHRFLPEATFDSTYQGAINSVKEPLTFSEVYQLANPLITQVRCGHVGIDFSADYKNYLENKCRKLPLNIVCLQNKIYVKQDLSQENEIPVGAEIKSVNAAPDSLILAKLLPVFSADGYISTFQPHVLSRHFRNVYTLYFGENEKYVVSYMYQNKLYTKTVNGLTEDNIKSNSTKRYGDLTKPPYSLQFEKNQTAILRFDTFNQSLVMNEQYNIYSFIANSFATIKEKGFKHLIIDMRNNAGGNGNYCLYLVMHLINTNLQMSERIETKLNHQPSFSNTYPVGPASDYKQIAADRYMVIANYPVLVKQVPEKNTFNGKLYVLTSGFTFSAGGQFCIALKSLNRATFIGEETGTDFHQNQGLSMLGTLKNTGLQFEIPFQTYFSSTNIPHPEGRGVLPDYPVVHTKDDYFSGKDVEMDIARKLIRNGG